MYYLCNMKCVHQKHSMGCGLAALAMITGSNYDEIIKFFSPPIDFNKDGISFRAIDAYLVDHGYAIARKFQHYGFFNCPKREIWPPQPFAPIHLCEVRVYENAPCTHFVIMLSNGRILDPINDEHKNLNFYFKVISVAGIYKV
jgi:DNA primase large subunit